MILTAAGPKAGGSVIEPVHRAQASLPITARAATRNPR